MRTGLVGVELGLLFVVQVMVEMVLKITRSGASTHLILVACGSAVDDCIVWIWFVLLMMD